MIAQFVRHAVHDHALTLGEVPVVDFTPVVARQYGAQFRNRLAAGSMTGASSSSGRPGS